MLRFALLGVAVGAAIGCIVLSHIEVFVSPMPLVVVVFGSIGVVLAWLARRSDPDRVTYPALLGCLGLAFVSVNAALEISEFGAVSGSLVLQALAFVAFAGFVLVDMAVVRKNAPDWLWRPWFTVVPLAALAVGVWVLLTVLNPVSTSEPPEGDAVEEVSIGDSALTVYHGGIVAETPDGSWSYVHRGAQSVLWPNQNHVQSPVVASPDGEHVAVAFVLQVPRDAYGELGYAVQEIVVFETRTGNEVVRVSRRTFVNVQLADSVALIGRDAYSLETGNLLWHSEEVELGMLSMSGTPERFIADARCERDVDHLLSCELDLINAADGARIETLTALGDARSKYGNSYTEDVLVVDGWVLDRAGEADEAPSLDEASFDVEAEMVARNLDTGETVPIGAGAGLDASQGRLGIRSPVPATQWDSDLAAATAWFDPETKQVRR